MSAQAWSYQQKCPHKLAFHNRADKATCSTWSPSLIFQAKCCFQTGLTPPALCTRLGRRQNIDTLVGRNATDWSATIILPRVPQLLFKLLKHVRLLFCRADLQNAVCWSGTKTHSVCSYTKNKTKRVPWFFLSVRGKKSDCTLPSAQFTERGAVPHMDPVYQTAACPSTFDHIPPTTNRTVRTVLWYQSAISNWCKLVLCSSTIFSRMHPSPGYQHLLLSLQHVDIKFWTHLHMQCANRHADPGQAGGGVDHGTTAQCMCS